MSSAYLVTGAAGFIGSHIAETLVAQGDRVRVLDNFSTGKRQNIAPLLDRIDLVEGDLQTAIKAVYTDPRPGDVKHSLADTRKSRKLLGYTPHVPLEEGLRRTVAFFTADGR